MTLWRYLCWLAPQERALLQRDLKHSSEYTWHEHREIYPVNIQSGSNIWGWKPNAYPTDQLIICIQLLELRYCEHKFCLLWRFISSSCPNVSSSKRAGSKVPPLPRRWEGILAYRRTCFQWRGRMAGLKGEQTSK